MVEAVLLIQVLVLEEAPSSEAEEAEADPEDREAEELRQSPLTNTLHMNYILLFICTPIHLLLPV